jgi:hypothetical protein
VKVTLVQSGGFGGLRVATVADAESLAPDKAHELKGLVEAAGFFELPEQMGIPPKHADRFQYRIAVSDGDRDRTIRVSDEALSDPLKELVRWVQTSGTRV